MRNIPTQITLYMEEGHRLPYYATYDDVVGSGPSWHAAVSSLVFTMFECFRNINWLLQERWILDQFMRDIKRVRRHRIKRRREGHPTIPSVVAFYDRCRYTHRNLKNGLERQGGRVLLRPRLRKTVQLGE
jgi:hypothetical protein